MLKDTLRQAFENVLAHVEPSGDMAELIEVKLSICGLETTKEVCVNLYWDDDERMYRISEKVEIHPILDEVEELLALLEDEL